MKAANGTFFLAVGVLNLAEGYPDAASRRHREPTSENS
jgi:hypothetical protein